MPTDILGPIPTERLAYWYFRLNGCLLLENFVVHPDDRGGQRTDADLLGVRFPHRAELWPDPMPDHGIFAELMAKPLAFIAEVKLDECELNGPWTNSAEENIHRVLRAIGVVDEPEIGTMAQSLYRGQRFDGRAVDVRLIAIGDRVNEAYVRRRPGLVQITWEEILRFIHCRFRCYRQQKANHPQWDRIGQTMWALATQHKVEEFVDAVRLRLDTPGSKSRLRPRSVQEPDTAQHVGPRPTGTRRTRISREQPPGEIHALGEKIAAALREIPLLVKAAQQAAHPEARKEAAWALGQIAAAAPATMPGLLDALAAVLKQDTHDGVRGNAAKAIGRIGSRAESALPALKQALSDARNTVRRIAKRSIRNVRKEKP